SSKSRLFNIISYIQIRCFGVGFMTVPWYPYAYRTGKPKKTAGRIRCRSGETRALPEHLHFTSGIGRNTPAALSAGQPTGGCDAPAARALKMSPKVDGERTARRRSLMSSSGESHAHEEARQYR